MCLTTSEIDSLVKKIVGRIQPEKVIIFGSYAKGTATIKSDLDLFIIKQTELPVANRGDNLKSLLTHILIPVDVHIYTPEEVAEYTKEPYSFVESVLKTGKIVFEK